MTTVQLDAAHPDTLYHYTSGFSLACILCAGSIQPSRWSTAAEERPAVWLTFDPEWEETVAGTSDWLGCDWGKWRIAVNSQCGVLTVEKWKIRSRCPPATAKYIEKNPRSHLWRAQFKPIRHDDWNRIERLDGSVWSSVHWQPVLSWCLERRNGPLPSPPPWGTKREAIDREPTARHQLRAERGRPVASAASSRPHRG
jgi:hypothetical protein